VRKSGLVIIAPHFASCVCHFYQSTKCGVLMPFSEAGQ
jgi:hypothetical protein